MKRWHPTDEVGSANTNVGQLVWTPKMVNDYLRQTDVLFNAFNTDVISAKRDGRVDALIWSEWTDYLAAWRAFAQENKDTWFGHSVVEHAETYRDGLRTWRDRLRALGAKLRSGEPPKKEEEPWLDIGTTAIVAAAALGAFYIWLRSRKS
jgi:hypothetical protein